MVQSPVVSVLSCGMSGPLTRELLNSSSLPSFLAPSPWLPHPQLDPDLWMSLSFPHPTHEALNLAHLPFDPPFPELTYARECLT